MDKATLIKAIWETFEPGLAGLGYELVEVEYTTQDGTPVLRVYIDKPEGGISHADCAAASELLSVELDTHDLIDDRYMLEVSSPGFDRPVRKPVDFQRFVGEAIRLNTYAPVQGRKRFSGVLAGFSDGLISLQVDGETYQVHIENLKKARLQR